MRPKVLQLRCCTGFFGAENVILELAKGLNEITEFHPVVGVLTNGRSPKDALAAAARRTGIDTVEFNCRSGVDLGAIGAIRQYVRDQKIPILHSHGYKADFYAWAVRRELSGGTLATCHPWTEVTYSARARFYASFDKRLLRRFTKLVAVSDSVRGELVKAGFSSKAMSVIENGIELGRFRLGAPQARIREKLGLPRGKKIVGTIGRLVKEKAHDVLLRAAKETIRKHPDALFVIVGDGPLRSALQDEAVRLGIAANVLFTGVSDRIPEMLSAFDIFVLSSVSEGMPMVILEAMASRKPIVTTGVGSISSVVIHGISGLVVKPDPSELSEAVSFVLANSAAASRLAEGAYERVKRKYSAEAMTEKYADLYRDMSRSISPLYNRQN